MEFSWDRVKANANLRKHRVSFEEAKSVFNDPHLLTFPDEWHSDAEERQISIGLSSINRLLLIIHTD
jgi:uncharacterized DUF497 family protein